jgi:hypothetical protein
MKSTTTRNRNFFMEQGYIVGTLEKWNAFAGHQVEKDPVICPDCRAEIPQYGPAGIRQDLWQFADLIVFHPDKPGVILVQSTSGSNHAARKSKVLENDIARDWIDEPGRMIAIVSSTHVAKKKKDGTKSLLKEWKIRVEFLTEEDFGKEPF